MDILKDMVEHIRLDFDRTLLVDEEYTSAEERLHSFIGNELPPEKSHVLLKEIYHNGAIVCLYRIETSQGETAGFYNTQTKQFVSMFTHTEEQTTLLGNYIENTILWCYAAFVGSDTSILPTTESYNEYLSDPNAEITFTSIGGKLRVPTETKHIRTIAGDDRYETEVKHISGYIRKLPDGQKASERAVTLAQSLGYDLADNETYVQPFERSSWIIRK